MPLKIKACGSMASLSVSLKNATDDFDETLSYALGAIGKKDLCLKDEQELAIWHLYEGYVFLWLPTGFGKSICFECLPFLFDVKLGRKEDTCSCSVVLVISPLVSLMSDQVSSLRKRGVAAAILSSHGICDKSFLANDKDLQTPLMFSLLFASPEAVIGATRWRERLMNYPLNDRIVALTIDEAHCVSKWYVTS